MGPITGQELHRVLANELAYEVEGESQALAQQLREILEEQAVSPPQILAELAADPAPSLAVATVAQTRVPTPFTAWFGCAP